MKFALAAVVAATVVLFAASRQDSKPQAIASPATDSNATQQPTPEPELLDNPAEQKPPGELRPRRFRSSSDRQQFANALARARLEAGNSQVRTKTYDFSGERISQQPGRVPLVPARTKLDKNYIKDRIAEIRPLLKECYELALTEEPALSGQLTVEFVVDAEEEVGGYVREAAIAEDSPLQTPLLSECVTETILSLEFVAPEGGGEVRVRYPFMFETVAD